MITRLKDHITQTSIITASCWVRKCNFPLGILPMWDAFAAEIFTANTSTILLPAVTALHEVFRGSLHILTQHTLVDEAEIDIGGWWVNVVDYCDLRAFSLFELPKILLYLFSDCIFFEEYGFRDVSGFTIWRYVYLRSDQKICRWRICVGMRTSSWLPCFLWRCSSKLFIEWCWAFRGRRWCAERYCRFRLWLRVTPR